MSQTWPVEVQRQGGSAVQGQQAVDSQDSLKFGTFSTIKKWFFAFFIKLIWPGVSFLNRTGAEIGYYYCWRNSKIPQVPSSGHIISRAGHWALSVQHWARYFGISVFRYFGILTTAPTSDHQFKFKFKSKF